MEDVSRLDKKRPEHHWPWSVPERHHAVWSQGELAVGDQSTGGVYRPPFGINALLGQRIPILGVTAPQPDLKTTYANYV